MNRLLLGFLISVIATMGCAKVQVLPVDPKDMEAKGLRFNRPWPYLWITAENKGGCTMAITYLPRTNQEYRMISKAGIGTVKLTATLTNGWSLTSLDTAVESKASEMVTALGNLTANAAKLTAGGKGLDTTVTYGP